MYVVLNIDYIHYLLNEYKKLTLSYNKDHSSIMFSSLLLCFALHL